MSDLSGDDATAAREADRRQAAYFREELLRHIDALNKDSEKARQAMIEGQMRHDSSDLNRLQDELRSMIVERRMLTEMVAALERRFR